MLAVLYLHKKSRQALLLYVRSTALVDVRTSMSHQRSSLTDAVLGLVDPTPRGKERQVAPSLASFRASAVANNTNRSSLRLCYVSATTFRALPSGRDRFTALSASTCPCDAIATNRGYPSPWFDLLLVIKALSPYPAATPANSNLSLTYILSGDLSSHFNTIPPTFARPRPAASLFRPYTNHPFTTRYFVCKRNWTCTDHISRIATAR